MASAAWVVPSPQNKYGGAFMTPERTTNDDTPMARAAGPANAAPEFSINSPMFWVGAVLLGAVGLAAASTTVRVGPVKAGVSLGDTGK